MVSHLRFVFSGYLVLVSGRIPLKKILFEVFVGATGFVALVLELTPQDRLGSALSSLWRFIQKLRMLEPTCVIFKPETRTSPPAFSILPFLLLFLLLALMLGTNMSPFFLLALEHLLALIT